MEHKTANKTAPTEDTKMVCDSCKKEITSGVTYDVWAFVTVWDKFGNFKTGEPLDGIECKDYFVFGSCCLEKLQSAMQGFEQYMTEE